MTGKSFGFAAALVALLAAGAATAEPLGVPPGRWWAQPRIAEQVGLSAEQTQQLESLTVNHLRSMVDLKAVVEKAQIDLRAAAETDPFDAKQVRTAFAALQQARTRLETERFEMLLKVRQVLTTEQWRKLRDIVRERRERGEEPGGQMGGRPQPRKWRN